MSMRSRCSLVLLLSTAMFAASIQQAARAGVITTQQYLSAVDRQQTIDRLQTAIARDDVRNELERLGVDPAAASERVAALTDDELQVLAKDLDGQPAGGEILAGLGIVFIVLLVLELTGVIDIFKRI